MESPYALHNKAQIAFAADACAHGCIPRGHRRVPAIGRRELFQDSGTCSPVVRSRRTGIPLVSTQACILVVSHLSTGPSALFRPSRATAVLMDAGN
jgi:hypothetical protein